MRRPGRRPRPQLPPPPVPAGAPIQRAPLCPTAPPWSTAPVSLPSSAVSDLPLRVSDRGDAGRGGGASLQKGSESGGGRRVGPDAPHVRASPPLSRAGERMRTPPPPRRPRRTPALRPLTQLPRSGRRDPQSRARHAAPRPRRPRLRRRSQSAARPPDAGQSRGAGGAKGRLHHPLAPRPRPPDAPPHRVRRASPRAGSARPRLRVGPGWPPGSQAGGLRRAAAGRRCWILLFGEAQLLTLFLVC